MTMLRNRTAQLQRNIHIKRQLNQTRQRQRRINKMRQMQKQYQIFHWQTTSFSQHKSFGKIYESLDESIDTFIETYMGKYGRVISASKFNLEMSNYSDLNFVNATDSYIEFLINLTNMLDAARDTDLLNIRDEILGNLNRLKYLLTLV